MSDKDTKHTLIAFFFQPGMRKITATVFICVLTFIVDIVLATSGKDPIFGPDFYQWVIGIFFGANLASKAIKK